MGRLKKRRRKFEQESDIPFKKEKKSLTGPIVFAILVIGIMSLSAVGLIQGNDTSGTVRLPYNDFKFKTDQNNNWIGEVDDEEYVFYNHPLNVEDLVLDEIASTLLRTSAMITMTSDVNSTAAELIGGIEYDLATTLNSKGIATEYAFTTENKYNKPVVDCSSSIPVNTVIYFKQSNQTSIRFANNCIIAEATGQTNFIRIRDRLLFSICGVMK